MAVEPMILELAIIAVEGRYKSGLHSRARAVSSMGVFMHGHEGVTLDRDGLPCPFVY